MPILYIALKKLRNKREKKYKLKNIYYCPYLLLLKIVFQLNATFTLNQNNPEFGSVF